MGNLLISVPVRPAVDFPKTKLPPGDFSVWEGAFMAAQLKSATLVFQYLDDVKQRQFLAVLESFGKLVVHEDLNPHAGGWTLYTLCADAQHQSDIVTAELPPPDFTGSMLVDEVVVTFCNLTDGRLDALRATRAALAVLGLPQPDDQPMSLVFDVGEVVGIITARM